MIVRTTYHVVVLDSAAPEVTAPDEAVLDIAVVKVAEVDNVV